MVTADAYALNGITPPLAPYPYTPAQAGLPVRPNAASYAGPGPLIGDSPARILIPGGAMLDASVYGWRVGPYLEVPVFDWLSCSVSAGLALAYVDSDFSYLNYANNAMQTTSHSDLLAGGYAGLTFSAALCKQANVFAGVQYQNVGTFTQSDGRKKAELDLGESIFLTLGLSIKF